MHILLVHLVFFIFFQWRSILGSVSSFIVDLLYLHLYAIYKHIESISFMLHWFKLDMYNNKTNKMRVPSHFFLILIFLPKWQFVFFSNFFSNTLKLLAFVLAFVLSHGHWFLVSGFTFVVLLFRFLHVPACEWLTVSLSLEEKL